ncbi:MAG TPA: magnesium-translocating P-type ATPase [Chloroflexota bacterium]|nr:magnesium-translocating P-type ATPase [Chloroflexota bacterium]
MLAAEPSPAAPRAAPPAPPAAGLTAAEAAARLARYGPNEVPSGHHFWAVRTLLGFLANPLVLILLAASIVSGVLGEPVNATLITLMIVLSVALDFFQVYRSEQAAAKLQALIPTMTTVWRDGRPVEVPLREVVPGDLLDLRAGDLIAADATLLAATTLSLDEAAMTGESLPVEKRPVSAPTDAAAPENVVLAGTSVVSGVGQALVTATGAHTQFGAIARGLADKAPPTAFELGTRRFGFLIMRTVIGLVLFVFLVNALLRRDPLESFLFALALAVGLTPEFLPMIITVTLSQGALRMARGKVIVKRLAAIENLGSMDTLCSDKTGTLTLGTVVLEQHVDYQGRESEAVLRWACVNSALESGLRSPMDAAILAHDHPSVTAYTKRGELPFDFERRRVSVLAEDRGAGIAIATGALVVVTKGAPEGIIPLCSRVEGANSVEPFTAERRTAAQQTYDQLSRDGYRVLAIAYKPAPADQTALTPEDERDLILAGFAAFLDPPDPTARDTIERLAASGVAMKILTGDGEAVTRAICAQVGIRVDNLVTGDELARMTDDALAVKVEQVTVFARISPAQKNRVIQALRRKRHVVGYLGDGINDAPSLHAADVGISVVNGVDVAKAAADIILLEKSLAAIHRGVVEGRRSFGNITKYVLMGTSSNFGNMLSMAAATAFLPFLPMLPVQILLNNFLYDLSQLTIPTDNVDASYTARPRSWDTVMVQRFMFGLGPVSSIYDFLTFGLMLWGFHAGEALFRTGWFVESLATQTFVIFVIRTAGNPFRSRPSRPLLLSVVGSVAVGVAITVSPLAGALGFTPLPPAFFGALAVLAGSYLALVEVVKRRIYAASGWRADR